MTAEEIKDFAYFNKYGKNRPRTRIIDKSKGKLLFEGRVIMEGVFPLLQHKKKELINNGCNPNKFKITY